MHTLQTDSYFNYFPFSKVIYNDKQKEKEIRKYLDDRLRFIEQPEKANAKEFLEKLISRLPPERRKDAFRELAYITTLLRFEPKLKIINYRNEFEIRMLFGRIQFQSYKDFFKGRLDGIYKELERAKSLNIDSSPEFRVMSGVIRKYIELKMEAIWDKQPIKEVILGPNCKTDAKEFNEFLELYKVSCKVEPSKINNRK